MAHILSHLKFSDACLGNFYDRYQTTFPRFLLAITGDHWSRRCLSNSPTLAESSTIPFVLAAPDVGSWTQAKPEHELIGAHIDISPTLVERCAPAGFSYFALGNDIFSANGNKSAFGYDRIISEDLMLSTSGKTRFESLRKEHQPEHPDLSQLWSFHQALRGISWWRVIKGTNLH